MQQLSHQANVASSDERPGVSLAAWSTCADGGCSSATARTRPTVSSAPRDRLVA